MQITLEIYHIVLLYILFGVIFYLLARHVLTLDGMKWTLIDRAMLLFFSLFSFIALVALFGVITVGWIGEKKNWEEKEAKW